jgi:hypothetical protein
MRNFAAYATDFELFPATGESFDHLSPLVRQIQRVEFVLRVVDPEKNQGQMDSDFDARLECAFLSIGSQRHQLGLPPSIAQELDFAFSYAGKAVAVEIEKANKEKILRDILKCHMYLHSGADFALIVLPRNYPHKHKVCNLFDFGVRRLNECRTYGFGTPDRLGRIALLGFTQHESATDEPLSIHTRQRMRIEASMPRENP